MGVPLKLQKLCKCQECQSLELHRKFRLQIGMFIQNYMYCDCSFRERSIPVVRETWLVDSIEKQEAQPLDAYEVVADLAPYGKGVPWDKQDPGEEAIESISAEVIELICIQ